MKYLSIYKTHLNYSLIRWTIKLKLDLYSNKIALTKIEKIKNMEGIVLYPRAEFGIKQFLKN